MSEILLKSIIYYLQKEEKEIKSLDRCKEIIELIMKSDDKRKVMINLLENNENARVLYKPVEIASAENHNFIFETLYTKLSKKEL